MGAFSILILAIAIVAVVGHNLWLGWIRDAKEKAAERERAAADRIAEARETRERPHRRW